MRLPSAFTGKPNPKRSARKDGILAVVRYIVIFSSVCLVIKSRILFWRFRSEIVSAIDSTPADISGIEVLVHNGLRRQPGTKYSPPGIEVLVHNGLRRQPGMKYSPLLPGASFAESRLKERKLQQNDLGSSSSSYPKEQVVDFVSVPSIE
jgi:hypothetical protein